MTALARMGQQGPFYIFAAFVFTYGTTVLHSSRNLLLAAVMCATALSVVTTRQSPRITSVPSDELPGAGLRFVPAGRVRRTPVRSMPRICWHTILTWELTVVTASH